MHKADIHLMLSHGIPDCAEGERFGRHQTKLTNLETRRPIDENITGQDETVARRSLGRGGRVPYRGEQIPIWAKKSTYGS